MKTWRLPAIVLGALYIGFALYVALSASDLPARVATHFDFKGQPNGWMSRSGHVMFILIFGFAFPLLAVALMFVIRFVPARMVNIPRRDYWLASERLGETQAYLLRQALWFACLSVCFIAGIHYLIVEANRTGPPQLSTPLIMALASAFVVGTVVWAAAMLLHFRRAV